MPLHGAEKDRWLHERKRLWTYACCEAVMPPAGDGDEEPISKEPAPKISVTGSNAHGQPVDLELFVMPCGDGRVLFGILSET